MKTDDLKELFDELDFDVAQPTEGHEDRFHQKLKKQSTNKPRRSGIVSLWGPIMAIAACFLLAFVLFQDLPYPLFQQDQELASVSPEMKQTQNFYASVIAAELKSLKAQKSPETEAIIEDALVQMSTLENDYNKLRSDLGKSGQDKRVIYAMISNFQKRIDLLKTVLKKVESINSLKNIPHEKVVL